MAKCHNCENCLGSKCDTYKLNKLKKAWENLVHELGQRLGIYKLLDWIVSRK
jgi:hypothetical protein